MISLLALIKTYGVGTQKNRYFEYNIGLEGQIRILEEAKLPLSRALEKLSILLIQQFQRETSLTKKIF